MKKRAPKGRFSKNDIQEGNILTFPLPSLKTIFAWIALIFILFPWIIIISKFNTFQRVEYAFDSFLKDNNEEIIENGKKSGLFY